MLLAVGAHPLVALAVIFVALTLAGMPIVFMLSVVGIIAFLPSFLGLEFWPRPDPLVPFSTSQSAMGLNSGSELIVILMFLVTAEVMNASGMSLRLIAFAAALVGHLRGGMAYVSQLTSLVASGISGSAQADAAIMTPLLVPAMEREGYRRDVAAAVVAGASIKGAIGPLSVMFIVYGSLGTGASVNALLLSGLAAVLLLLVFQMATVYVVVRRMDMLAKRRFAGWGTVGRTGIGALPVLLIPFIILGGIFSGVFTPTKSASVAALIAIGLALFWFADMSPRALPRVLMHGRHRDRHRDAADRRLGDPRQGALLRPLRPDAVGLLHRHHRQPVRLPAAGERAAAAGRRVHRAAAGALHPGAVPCPRSPSTSTASTRSTSG